MFPILLARPYFFTQDMFPPHGSGMNAAMFYDVYLLSVQLGDDL